MRLSLITAIIITTALGAFLSFRSCLDSHDAIDKYLTSHNFQGVVLIGAGEEILYSKGFGLANEEHKIPNITQTVYRIGSITKQFTAVVMMQLQEKGLLSVNDPISLYLTDYPNGDKITIHHLLTHSSGIPDITVIPNLTELQRRNTTALNSINFFKDLPLDFTPGSDCKYSNSGYIVLGAIIEKVTNQPYELYLQENILRPLQLKGTYAEATDQIMTHRASGYRRTENEILKHADFIDMSFPHASGGLSSTATDLFTFTRSFKGNVLLSDESLATIFTIHAASKTNGISYGYGFRIGPNNKSMEGCDSNIIGHAGSIEGFESMVVRYDDINLTIILLSNIEKTNVRLFHKELADIIPTSWRLRPSF